MTQASTGSSSTEEGFSTEFEWEFSQAEERVQPRGLEGEGLEREGSIV